MRIVKKINDKWKFVMDGKTEDVTLPHTWNNIDGQNGEHGYNRGVGVYTKILDKYDGEIYAEFLGANSKAEVFVNGEKVAAHKGGYSAFYVNLTGRLTTNKNEMQVKVDNSPDESVYPTMADFTFYGGLYRDVNVILFDTKYHFDVTGNGCGVFVDAVKRNAKWVAAVTAKVNETFAEAEVHYKILDMSGNQVNSFTAAADGKTVEISVEKPVLWQGVENPYIYTVVCEMVVGGKTTDRVEVKTGFREIIIDKDKGFFLNGKHVKIKGVSRHQDRENLGNAITVAEHEEDVKLIKEIGANSVRLAHYQQNRDFYDICDREGLLVWAEVPVISRYSKKRQENAKSQLTELITQSKNHPSIFCWSICNEITIAGEAKGLFESIEELNALAKKLDKTRYTALAEVAMCPLSSRLNGITDILGYNHYFGWYMGTFKDLDEWLVKWRKECPDKKLCLSEYGAEGILAYQSDKQSQGDYSEGYQAVFHENYIKRINAADWLWGSYVWNMFDFGSAARNEGGVRGRNNKGLITFDRKTKKDSFYLYKAYWSEEPFVYIAGCRYNKRLIGKTTVKVYSNQPEITLIVNGIKYTQKADKVFVFNDLSIESGENFISASAGKYTHEIVIEGVTKTPDSYVLPTDAESMVRNWFDGNPDEYKPDCFSIDDKVGALLKNTEVKNLLKKFAGKKADSKLLYLVFPFKVRTLLKLPFIKIGDEMIETANRYLQTIKK